MTPPRSFSEVFGAATGRAPYAWQERLSSEALPELLEVPTGCGKTAGVVGTWIHRRRFHPDPEVRATTPRRLVFVLPMRTLVDQTIEVVTRWVDQLGLADAVPVVTMMGGEPIADRWRLEPWVDCVIVGTLDMVLSRGLNRGYAASRYAWPVDFGLLNNDCQFVFDETQLMGPAALTARQLQAFRLSFGTAIPCHSTFMSATLDVERLRTVDAPDLGEPFRLTKADKVGELRTRLDAERRVSRWCAAGADPKRVVIERAGRLIDAHRPGTLTLAVLNTVAAARELHARLAKSPFDGKLVLLHSRFRPPDRAAVLAEALASPAAAGTIVVSTQVIEAGVDLSATTLATELAPWSSVVQRAGRCNRDGQSVDAVLLWDTPSQPLPYLAEDIAATGVRLTELDGEVLTTERLSSEVVAESTGAEPLVLRRRDLVSLFDTAPDLAGNDLDIGPYLRDGDDRDLQVCWREIADGQPVDRTTPARDELCSVPLAELRTFMKAERHAVFRLDHTESSRAGRGRTWVDCEAAELRPGQVVLIDFQAGGYTPDGGWDQKASGPVPLVQVPVEQRDLAPLDETLSADPGSASSRRVDLPTHLDDVEQATRETFGDLATPGLTDDHRVAAAAAGKWHDLGKAHATFQAAVRTVMHRSGEAFAEDDVLWAKSGGRGRLDYADRQFFRHELASALALLGDGRTVIERYVEADLVAYLVASHHGRVRMSIRRAPTELGVVDGVRQALGVRDGDLLPAVTVGGETVPAATMCLDVMELGGGAGDRSWATLTTGLRDRADLGPFRLAFLEAVVRAADWRVSRSYDVEVSP